MFATLRYGEHDGDLRAVEQSTTFPVQGQGSQHYACFECRHRKLKCTGEKAGCNRCIASGSECAYPRAKPSKRGGQRTKRSADDVGKSPETHPSEADMQPAQSLPRPAVSESRRDDQPTRRVTPEHQSLPVAPVAPMLPNNGNDEMLFAAPGDLGFAQLQDFYGIEDMPDTQMKEVFEVSGFDRLSRDMDSMEGAGGASGPFVTGSARFGGGLNFDDMFDFGDAAISSGSPAATKASGVRPVRKRTTSGLAASRAATQPMILTPEPSRSSSSQRAVTPEDGECASLAMQRTNKPRSAVPQHSGFELAPSHTESRCIKQAMSLSYKAHFCSKQGVRTSTAALFRLLSEFRQCVQALNALAACVHCTSSAPFMTFLADVCERLGEGLTSMATLSAKINIDGGGMDQQLTDGYMVDSQEEFTAIFGMLAARHLAVLRQVAAKMKLRASSGRCRPALIVLQETERRLAGIEQVLGSAAAGENCISADLDGDLDGVRF